MTDQLKRISSNPTNKSNIEQVKEILFKARKQNISVSPDVIKSTANKFISASKVEPIAWEIVQQYLDYRSFLNATLAPYPKDLKQIDSEGEGTFYAIPLSPNGRVSVYIKSGVVSPDKSARLEELNNPRVTSNTEFFVLEGKDISIRLDGYHMRNVIIRNSNIEYHGGSLVLENVFFTNCTFNFEFSSKGQDLANAILSGTATQFIFCKSPV